MWPTVSNDDWWMTMTQLTSPSLQQPSQKCVADGKMRSASKNNTTFIGIPATEDDKATTTTTMVKVTIT